MESIELEVEKLKTRVTGLEEDTRESRESRRTIYGRLDKIEKQNVTTELQYNQIMITLTEMKADIQSLKEKPNKRLDLIITTIISLLITGFGMYLITQMLGG